MKELILAALTAKFVGVDAKILNRIAEKMAKTVMTEDGITAAVEGVTFQQVVESEADRRATEATQNAVTNYEKKHSIKEGKSVTQPVTAPTGTAATDDDNKETPAWAKALADSNKALADRLARMEGDKVVTSRKQKLESIVAQLPENLRKPYSRISLDSMTDEDFETLSTDVTIEVEGLAGDLAAKGVVTAQPHGKGKAPAAKEPTAAELDAALGTV